MSAPRVPSQADVADLIGNAAQVFVLLLDAVRTSPVPEDYLACAHQAHARATGLAAELGALLGAAERFPVPATSLARALAYSREARS